MTQRFSTVSTWKSKNKGLKFEPNKKRYLLTSIFLAPDFVKMLEDDDYVYFFLREQAVEYINCGKVREIKNKFYCFL